MGMRIRMTSNFMTVIHEKRTYFFGMDAFGFGIAKIFGIEVERTFHTVFVEKFNESSVLCTTVVITERQGIAFTVFKSVK